MEKLKFVLIGVVALLAVAVAYGAVRGGEDENGEGGTTAAEVATAGDEDAPPAVPAPDAADPPADGNGRKQQSKDRAGKREAAESGGTSSTPKPDGGGGESTAPKSQPDRDAPDSGGSGAASRSAAVRAGNGICAGLPAAIGRELQRLEAEERAAGRPADFEALYPRAAKAVLLGAAKEFAALPAPSGDRRELAALAGSLRTAAREAGETSFGELRGQADPLTGFKRLAKGYGLATCARM